MRRRDFSVGTSVHGREVVAVDGRMLTLRCACGRDSVVKRTSIYAASRCRACGYADMRTGHKEQGGPEDGHHARRIEICRAVVSEVGIASDGGNIEGDLTIAVALERFERSGLGGMPFTAAETGMLMGLSRAGVGVIETRALRKMRGELAHLEDDIVDALRERDADRDPFTREAYV